jgi:hypothetical protein
MSSIVGARPHGFVLLSVEFCPSFFCPERMWAIAAALILRRFRVGAALAMALRPAKAVLKLVYLFCLAVRPDSRSASCEKCGNHRNKRWVFWILKSDLGGFCGAEPAGTERGTVELARFTPGHADRSETLAPAHASVKGEGYCRRASTYPPYQRYADKTVSHATASTQYREATKATSGTRLRLGSLP